VLDLHPFASTSPIYVQVGDAPIRSREDAEYFLTWLDRLEAGIRAHTGWNTPAERDESLNTLAAARAEFVRRRS
jgi:TolB protein